MRRWRGTNHGKPGRANHVADFSSSLHSFSRQLSRSYRSPPWPTTHRSRAANISSRSADATIVTRPATSSANPTCRAFSAARMSASKFPASVCLSAEYHARQGDRHRQLDRGADRRALQTGVRPDGRILAPIMPWHAFAQLTADDARRSRLSCKASSRSATKSPDRSNREKRCRASCSGSCRLAKPRPQRQSRQGLTKTIPFVKPAWGTLGIRNCEQADGDPV